MSETRVPAIPAPTDANLRDVARAVKGLLDVREGLVGDPLDSNVTFRDLAEGGIISVSTVNRGGGSGGLLVAPPSQDTGYDPSTDLTPPPAPTGFVANAGLAVVILEWNAATYGNHAYTEIWRSETNVLGSAELIGSTTTPMYNDAIGVTGATRYYWIRFRSQADVVGAYNSTNGTAATTGKIGNVDLGPLIVEAGNLASGAVTATKLAAQAVDLTKFANGIEPVSIVDGSTVPTTKTTNTIFLAGTGKLYRWDGTAYVATVPAADLTGQVIASQIADAAVTTAKFASSIEPITVVVGSTVPTTKSTNTIFLTGTGKLYRWTGSAYVATVPTADLTGTVTNAQIEGLAASKVTGQLTDAQIADVAAAKLTGQVVSSQIADAAITTAKFASSIEPITVVSAVPGTKSTNSIFNTTDGKLYRWNGTAYVATVASADISGTLTAAQIASLAASQITGQLTNEQIAAVAAAKLTGTVSSAQIADGSISGAKFASGIEPIEVVSALPTTGNFAGRVAFLTTDNKLYRHTGSAWVSSVASSDISGTISDAQIAGLAASKVTGQLSDSQIAAVAAAKVTGQLTASQLNVAVGGGNLLPNSSFRASDTVLPYGWATYNNGGIPVTTQVSSGGLFGTNFFRITSNADTTQSLGIYARTNLVGGGVSGGVRAWVPGITYVISFWVRAAGSIMAGRTVTAVYSNMGWDSYETVASPTLINGTWQRYVARVRPANNSSTAAGELFISWDISGTLPSGAAYDICAVQVEQGDVASAYAPRTDEILPGTITTTEISDNAITTPKLVAEAVVAGKIAADAVTADKIAANAVTAGKIEAGAVTTAKLAAGAVTADTIASNAVTAAKIEAGAITTAKLAAGAVTANEIAAATITGGKIAAGTITGSNIAADTITAGQIAAGAIGASEIAAGAVFAEKLAVLSREFVNPSSVTKTLVGWGGVLEDGTGGAASQTFNATENAIQLSGTLNHSTRTNTWAVNHDKIYRISVKLRKNAAVGLYYIGASAYASNTEGAVSAGGNAQGALNLTPFDANRAVGTTAVNVYFASGSATTSYVDHVYYLIGANRSVSDCPAPVGPGGSPFIKLGSDASWVAIRILNWSNDGVSRDLFIKDVAVTEVGAGQIVADNISSGAITTAKLAAGAVTANEVAANAITAAKIEAGAVTTAKLAAGAVTANEIAAATITGGKIAAGTITGSNIAADSITAGQIAAGAITASEIAANAITASKIVVTNGDSVFPDPGWHDRTWWTGGSSVSGNIFAAESGTWPVRRVLQFNGNVGNYDFITSNITVELGATYRYKVWIYVDSAFAGSFTLLAHWPDQAWFELGIPRSGTTFNGWTAVSQARDQWISYTSSFTNSAGLVSTSNPNTVSQFKFAGSQSAGNVYIGIEMVRASGADLIVDGAVTAAKVAAGSISTAKLDANAVTADKIASNAVTAAKIEAGAITTAKIAAGAVTASEIAAGTITGDRIAAGTITGSNIAADTITAGQIAAGAISASELAAGAVTTAKLAAGAVTANEIAASTITGAKIAAATITGSNIAADTITAGQIAAGAIGASEIAAGAITTDKLLVTGRGAALNDDPNTQDVTAWTGSGLSIISDSTSPAGNTVLRCASGGATVLSRRVALDPTRNHQFRIWTRQETGSSTTYLTVAFEDASGNNISGGSTGWASGTYHYFGLVNGALPAAWTEYRVSFGPNEAYSIPSGARYVRVGVLSNYTGTGTQLVTGVRLMLKADADLIVDGAISANKIAANAIAVGTAAIQNGAIVNAMLGNAIIDTAKIADGAITTAKIGDAQITNAKINDLDATKITAGTISANRIGANSITAAKIDSRGLDIKDANGNVIFSSGTPLTASYITPASGWLNSNISVDTSGNIQGIGTGAGQSVANNVNSRINAPDGGIYTTTASSVSGAIRIRLPARVNTDYPMVKFTVEIYEYVSNYSCILSVSGHTSGTGWYNTSANLIGGSVEYPVYFGHDGTYFVVWIGDTGETWSYPQVFISDVLVGYSSVQSSLWSSNWNITFSTSSRTNITQQVLDTYPAADWSKTARRPSNLSALSGTESIQNSQITISGGAIQGIGTGAGTAVANSGISIGANGALLGGGGGQVTLSGVGFTGDTDAQRNSRITIDSTGNLIGIGGGNTRLGRNLLDSARWVYNTSGTQTGFTHNPTSSGGSNSIALTTTPDGTAGNVWVATSGSASGTSPEGGWNTPLFFIDHTKPYRFTVWVRRVGANATGSYYLGCGENSVNNLGGGANGNPYFLAEGRGVLPDTVWCLAVGYVWPSSYSGGQSSAGGLYDSRTGARISASTDFRWISGGEGSRHRAYQYYTTGAGARQDFFDPRVEVVDGTEPSIAELLATAAPSARNQITSSNASTYIASAAIGDAQIANTIQSTNYSSSAGWQINKTGSATFNEVALRGAINSGAYTGWAWPASGTGFHLGPNGLLLGNANSGKYFQVESSGNVYAPGMNIINGTLTIAQANVIGTAQVQGNSITTSALYSYYNPGVQSYAYYAPELNPPDTIQWQSDWFYTNFPSGSVGTIFIIRVQASAANNGNTNVGLKLQRGDGAILAHSVTSTTGGWHVAHVFIARDGPTSGSNGYRVQLYDDWYFGGPWSGWVDVIVLGTLR